MRQSDSETFKRTRTFSVSVQRNLYNKIQCFFENEHPTIFFITMDIFDCQYFSYKWVLYMSNVYKHTRYEDIIDISAFIFL